MKVDTPSILLIYTGGTIGMIKNEVSGALENFNFERLMEYIPEVKEFNHNISAHSFNPPMDSSDLEPSAWVAMAKVIEDNYEDYDGFVILHGTDTMAYSASALSFMLQDLNKPVIFTGSQLPIGMLRTDGKENLITSIEIAGAKDEEGLPMVPEVCIFFENKLMRGNRTTKIHAENFSAFRSFNYPCLAEAGIHIKYNTAFIKKPTQKKLTVRNQFDPNVVVLTLFPGIQEEIVHSVLHIKGIKALLLKTYGSGNAPQKEWLIRELKEAINRGIVVVNVTQCPAGSVEMERYETGIQLLKIGVTSGHDSTSECAITKLMFLLGQGFSSEKVRELMETDLIGEVTEKIQ